MIVPSESKAQVWLLPAVIAVGDPEAVKLAEDRLNVFPFKSFTPVVNLILYVVE